MDVPKVINPHHIATNLLGVLVQHKADFNITDNDGKPMAPLLEPECFEISALFVMNDELHFLLTTRTGEFFWEPASQFRARQKA